MFSQENDRMERGKKVTFNQTINSEAENITRFNFGMPKDKKVTFSQTFCRSIPTDIEYKYTNESLCSGKQVELKFLPPNISYYDFNAMLDLWFVILMDEINIFTRQCEENNLRDQLVMSNEVFVTNIYSYVKELVGQENWLEMNVHCIECCMLNIENTLDYLELENTKIVANCLTDRTRDQLYENLINISMDCLKLENNAKEIQCYLNKIVEEKLLCVSTGMVYHIIKLNENTIGKMKNDLLCLEKFSDSVEKDLRKFEQCIRYYCIP